MSATGISLMHAGPNQTGSQARIDHGARSSPITAPAVVARRPLRDAWPSLLQARAQPRCLLKRRRWRLQQ
jgi:hypothetical protein